MSELKVISELSARSLTEITLYAVLFYDFIPYFYI